MPMPALLGPSCYPRCPSLGYSPYNHNQVLEKSYLIAIISMNELITSKEAPGFISKNSHRNLSILKRNRK